MENQSPQLMTGEKAPDFFLPSNQNETWRLSEQIGKVVVLLFYPQNETLVCTKQLCSLRDEWRNYVKTGAEMIGISPNSVEANQMFIEKHNLPLTILADENRRITNQFGSHWLFPTSLTRSIIIVDANGLIRSKQVMLRAFRPRDSSVITSIYSAKADLLTDKYKEMVKKSRNKF